MISLLITSSLTSAVSYQSSNDIEFSLTPTISISTSGDLSIESLTPGNYNDSNTIDVTVSSNALAGYTLTSTVGTTGNLSNELRKDGTDTTNRFTSLTVNQSTLSGFSDNEWGYSYSTDNGSTWISGDIDSSSSGYNGYNYDTTTSTSETITHLSTSTPDSTTIKYKIGAKASNTQLAGNYTNTINFTAITKANPEVLDKTFEEAFLAAGKTKYNGYYTMQDMNKNICAAVKLDETTTLIDMRDNNTYTIAKLADYNCWMLDNLALDPTTLTQAELYGSDSKPLTNASNTTLGYLKGATTGTTSDKYATAAVSYWTSSYSYSAPLIAIKNASDTSWNPDTVPANSDLGAGSRKIGVYYNYCAASAGSYCYGDGTSAGASSGNAKESLCPYGWRMPTGNTSGEFNTLYTNSNYNNYTKYKTALSLPLSGRFHNGSAGSQGSYGFWWSSTRRSSPYMYYLSLNTSDVNPTDSNYRYRGLSLRCVLGS